MGRDGRGQKQIISKNMCFRQKEKKREKKRVSIIKVDIYVRLLKKQIM